MTEVRLHKFIGVQTGALVKRYKRFLADIELKHAPGAITAYCPNTGSMAGLLQPHAPALVSKSVNSTRKLQWDLHALRTAETSERSGTWVGIHSALANKFVSLALPAGLITGLRADSAAVLSELSMWKGSRADFVLVHDSSAATVVEVKSVSMADSSGLGLFPDSVSKRAAKHLEELTAVYTSTTARMQAIESINARLSKCNRPPKRQKRSAAAATSSAGATSNPADPSLLYPDAAISSVLIMLAQRGDVSAISPNASVDPEYARLLGEAVAKGVQVLCCKVELSEEGDVVWRGMVPLVLPDGQTNAL